MSRELWRKNFPRIDSNCKSKSKKYRTSDRSEPKNLIKDIHYRKYKKTWIKKLQDWREISRYSFKLESRDNPRSKKHSCNT